MVMASDETQIQIFANWPMSHAKHVTRDNKKNPEYRFVTAIRNCGQTQTVPQENHGQTIKKYIYISSISDLKRPAASKILNS